MAVSIRIWEGIALLSAASARASRPVLTGIIMSRIKTSKASFACPPVYRFLTIGNGHDFHSPGAQGLLCKPLDRGNPRLPPIKSSMPSIHQFLSSNYMVCMVKSQDASSSAQRLSSLDNLFWILNVLLVPPELVFRLAQESMAMVCSRTGR